MRFLDETSRKFPLSTITEKIDSLRDLRVLVIGDAIIDRYYYSSAVGKSPKDNIIVAKHMGEENFAGGSLAAANHVAGFCEDVTLVTCLGKQETYERFIRRHLKKNVKSIFFYREDMPTPVKIRYVEPSRMTKMFGVSSLEDYELPADVEGQVCDYLNGTDGFDLVLVTDFGHGFITDEIRYWLYQSCFLAVNTQTNTDNAGFNLISKYMAADYICLDEPETRLAYQNKYGNIEDIVRTMADDFSCRTIAVTHGQYDTVMFSNGEFRYIPTLANGSRDTTGAGDAFLSVTSLCVARGFPLDLTGFIGNCVGALKLKIVCNRSSVEPGDLFRFMKELL